MIENFDIDYFWQCRKLHAYVWALPYLDISSITMQWSRYPIPDPPKSGLAVIPRSPMSPSFLQNSRIWGKLLALSMASAWGASSFWQKLNTVSLSCLKANQVRYKLNSPYFIKPKQLYWNKFFLQWSAMSQRGPLSSPLCCYRARWFKFSRGKNVGSASLHSTVGQILLENILGMKYKKLE